MNTSSRGSGWRSDDATGGGSAPAAAECIGGQTRCSAAATICDVRIASRDMLRRDIARASCAAARVRSANRGSRQRMSSCAEPSDWVTLGVKEGGFAFFLRAAARLAAALPLPASSCAPPTPRWGAASMKCCSLAVRSLRPSPIASQHVRTK